MAISRDLGSKFAPKKWMLNLHFSKRVFAIFVFVSTIFAVHGGVVGREQEKLPPVKNVLWTDPGDVSSLDFEYGVGGPERQPQPPFRFVKEDLSGTSPKVNVTDGRGVSWNIKWGREARPSTFCTRLLWACGYVAVPEYFLSHGSIEGVRGLRRAKDRVSDDGSFVNARFQLRSDSPRYLEESWTWSDNPFMGTRELQGLKILMLLVSNWDTKDARDTRSAPNGSSVIDSNLSIFEDNSSGEQHYLYADVDWGASLGKWGNLITWRKWDCKGFEEQTPNFLKGVNNGWLEWGFRGKHRKDVTEDISVYDVQWLLKYLGEITDAQIRTGLAASGAVPDEIDCYARALRQRVEQLQRAATEVPAQETGAQSAPITQEAR